MQTIFCYNADQDLDSPTKYQYIVKQTGDENTEDHQLRDIVLM